MGRSVSTIANQPDGSVFHKLSDSKITIQHDSQGKMLQQLQAHGLKAEYPIAYAVGAGKVGYSYLVALPPYLFQSPVSYYSEASLWDVTPGYEPERTLDFTHPIVEGCVFCHSNKPKAIPALTPISCERCHGDATRHLEKPVPGSIVNPRKLTGTVRDSICEQCHLEGEARILNPQKDWADFRAGDELESVFSTYLNRVSASEGTKAVSHAEQLSLSRCARQSGGKLWCGTCHNPHSDGTNRAQEVRAACLTCHALLFTSQKHAPQDECVSCHMPKLRPSNVAHAAITNHLISIPVHLDKPAAPPQPGAISISAWRTPKEFAERNLALAIFQIGSAKKDSRDVIRAYEILAHLPRRDATVSATLGSILLEQGYGVQAIKLLKQAAESEPDNARYAFLLGAAYAKQGSQSAAIEQLRRSISLDPSSPDPYRKLIDLYDRAGEPAESRRVVQSYLKFMPQNLEFRQKQ